MLELMIERVQRSVGIDKIVIATTTAPEDDAIVAFSAKMELACHRGEPKYVLPQFVDIAKKYHANVIVRLTADNPLLDYGVIDRVLWQHILNKQASHYVSNCWFRSFPRGMEVEVMSRWILDYVWEGRWRWNNLKGYKLDSFDIEHVTPYIRRYPNLWPVNDVQPITGRLEDGTEVAEGFIARLTVDYPEDFELVTKVFEALYPDKPDFSLFDIKNYLDDHPEVKELNAHIRQEG